MLGTCTLADLFVKCVLSYNYVYLSLRVLSSFSKELVIISTVIVQTVKTRNVLFFAFSSCSCVWY